MKSIQIRSYFWSVFSCIRIEYGDLRGNLRIQSEYRKIRTRNNSVFGHFSCSVRRKLISLHGNELVFFLFGFPFHNYSRIKGQKQKGGPIFLTPVHHFHFLHRYLDISRAIITDTSSLHIACALVTGLEPATVCF